MSFLSWIFGDGSEKLRQLENALSYEQEKSRQLKLQVENLQEQLARRNVVLNDLKPTRFRTKNWQYFTYEDFACPCCGENKIDSLLVGMLDWVRERAGIPIIINSGYRCKTHNQEVGGIHSSSHMKGLASDLHCVDSGARFRLVKQLFRAGFCRIILYKNFIHVDIDESKQQMVLLIKG